MLKSSHEIWLGNNDNFLEFSDSSNDTITSIKGVSRVNLIFGKNDSRKSRFLREILKMDEVVMFSEAVTEIIETIKSHSNAIKLEMGSAPPESEIWRKIYRHSFHLGSTPPRNSSGLKINGTDENVLTLERLQRLINQALTFQSTGNEVLDPFSVNYLHDYVRYHNSLYVQKVAFESENTERNKNINSHLAKLVKETEKLNELLLNTKFSPKRVYIPALRMTRNVFDQSHQNEGILKTDLTAKYSIQESDSLQIFDGLDLYNRILKLRNSIREERKQIDDFEKFLSETFFEGKQVDLVADLEKKSIRLYIEDGDDRMLFNRGDGIQNILMLLYPVFTCSDESWFFIEEPELNMHPGMQSLFLRTILNHEVVKKKKLRFFIVTHSNHLLDVGVDTNGVSFFTLSNNGKTSILSNQLSPNNNLLRELGVFNSSVVMSNCSIWVEGVSDRLFVKGFLKVYFDQFKKQTLIEGYNYSFLEYAGNNLMHYDFGKNAEVEKIKSFFLSNRIFLLADQDSGKETKHNELSNLADGKDFIYQTTISKEIENLISPKLLKLFLVERLKAKSERVEKYAIEYEDFQNIGFGSYLEKLAVDLKISKKRFTQKSSNTGALSAYYKKVLSEFVFEKCKDGLVSWDDLRENKNTETILTSLTRFLKTHN